MNLQDMTPKSAQAVPKPMDPPDAPSKLPEHVEEIPVLTTAQLEDKMAKDIVIWKGEKWSSELLDTLSHKTSGTLNRNKKNEES